MRLRKRRILLIVVVISIFIFAASFMTFVLSLLHTTFSRTYTSNASKCEVVHVGVVSIGYEPSYDFHTMLKSLYFHRDNPLHLHLIVDDVSQKNLDTLFKSWAVPHVDVSFYNIRNFAPDLWEIINKQKYPGTPELLKLAFSKIIPGTITSRLIVLDQHLFFADDIYDLWKLFNEFNDRQVLGLVENQANNHIRKGDLALALTQRKGFNYGVILCHLERFRSIGWDNLWLDVATETTSRIGTAGLSDPNIINTVISENLELVYILSCHWNTHFSGPENDYSCYNNNEIKVMHWNFPKKSKFEEGETDYFHSMHTTFAEYNGNLLRKSLYGCADVPQEVTKQPIDECFDFHEAHTHNWRTLLFFRKFKHAPTRDDVTFVSQLTYDRLQLLENLSELWDGPMSLTLYVTDSELQKSVEFIENSTLVHKRFNIAFHAVFKEDLYHPINILRNVALRNVITPYVFIDDIDLLPMQGLYSSLKEYLREMKSMEKKALIVPAFQTMPYGGHQIPKNKHELYRLFDINGLIPFSFYRFPEGHGPTNYTIWRHATAPYKVKWAADYEPYIVAQSNVSEYDERFVGYGWDKSSHIMTLEAQGYEFVVLPNAFVTHKNHAPSSDESHFLELPRYRRCLENLNKNVIKELNEKYGQQFVIK